MPAPGPSGAHDQSSAPNRANDASSSSLSSGLTPLSYHAPCTLNLKNIFKTLGKYPFKECVGALKKYIASVFEACTVWLSAERFSCGKLKAIQEGRAMSRASVDIRGEGRVKGGAAAASELFPGRSAGLTPAENANGSVTAKPSEPQQ